MLQRLVHITLNVKICNRHNPLLFGIPFWSQARHNCGFRLYSSHKVSALRNYYERTAIKGSGLISLKSRFYSSQVDTQRNNAQFESVNLKTSIGKSKKVDLRSKSSELKRLLSLAAPEKWTLTGK